jgi:tellurite resistance protein
MSDMPEPNAYPTSSATERAGSLQSSDEQCADLRRVLENALRSSKELRQSAERARTERDHELATFFERCALSDEATMAEATELLHSRTRLSASEIPTAAAFAAGDGADDADVSPNSQRARSGIWPAH